LEEVKARLKKERPMIDLQRQLKGQSIVYGKTIGEGKNILAEYVCAIDTLVTFATGCPEEEYKRRAAAINALTVLYSLQEGRRFRRRHCRSYQLRES